METRRSSTARPSDLMTRLRRIAKRTLASAGPRYAPALDPNAPNLAIAPLQRAASALSVGANLRAHATELGSSLATAYDRDSHDADRLFGRQVVYLQRICSDLSGIASASLDGDVRKQVLLYLGVLTRTLGAQLSAVGVRSGSSCSSPVSSTEGLFETDF